MPEEQIIFVLCVTPTEIVTGDSNTLAMPRIVQDQMVQLRPAFVRKPIAQALPHLIGRRIFTEFRKDARISKSREASDNPREVCANRRKLQILGKMIVFGSARGDQITFPASHALSHSGQPQWHAPFRQQ